MPWWRRRKEQFRELFYSYDDIPAEPLRTLQRYYESRRDGGEWGWGVEPGPCCRLLPAHPTACLLAGGYAAPGSSSPDVALCPHCPPHPHPPTPIAPACHRARLGQPLSMYPPGRVLFLRPIKTRAAKEWEGVWIRPKDIVGAFQCFWTGCGAFWGGEAGGAVAAASWLTFAIVLPHPCLHGMVQPRACSSARTCTATTCAPWLTKP